jgi:hypothetical protein
MHYRCATFCGAAAGLLRYASAELHYSCDALQPRCAVAALRCIVLLLLVAACPLLGCDRVAPALLSSCCCPTDVTLLLWAWSPNCEHAPSGNARDAAASRKTPRHLPLWSSLSDAAWHRGLCDALSAGFGLHNRAERALAKQPTWRPWRAQRAARWAGFVPRATRHRCRSGRVGAWHLRSRRPCTRHVHNWATPSSVVATTTRCHRGVSTGGVPFFAVLGRGGFNSCPAAIFGCRFRDLGRKQRRFDAFRRDVARFCVCWGMKG